MQRLLAGVLVPLALAAMVIACEDEGSIDSSEGPTGDAIDRSAIFNSVEDVRAVIDDGASSLDPMLIENVDYSDGVLRVVLAESQNGLDLSGLESLCRQVSDAIALPDLRIVVEKADDSDTTECEFDA